MNFAPNDKLNTALTFYTSTDIKYETGGQKGHILPNGVPLSIAAGFPDGRTSQDDIPGQLGFGISYKFLPQLKVALNYVLYLEKSATIQTFSGEGNSWDLGITAEYTFSPQWKASVGYLYTDIKLPDDQQIKQPEEPKLDANTFGAGVVFSPTPKWDITFGGATLVQLRKDVTENPRNYLGHQVRQKRVEPVGRRHVEVLLINFEGGGIPRPQNLSLEGFLQLPDAPPQPRGAAVGTVRGILAAIELLQQFADLPVRQRLPGADGTVAGHELQALIDG